MSADAPAGTLYVVSTPIGNLGDFSYRAVEVLRSVAAVLAEDTRHSRALLERYEVRTPLVSHHEHNEAKTTPALLERLHAGDDLALISDAGTPLVSDPGGRLVESAIEQGIRVVPVPGASALLAALVAAGLPADRFTFFGFLPRGGRERREAIEELAHLRHTGLVYESPNRVPETLRELAAAGMGDRAAVLARELTKMYEEVRRGTLASLAAYYGETAPRGEVVLVIAGRSASALDEEALRARARALRAGGMTSRDIARTLAEELDAPRNLAYRISQEE